MALSPVADLPSDRLGSDPARRTVPESSHRQCLLSGPELVAGFGANRTPMARSAIGANRPLEAPGQGGKETFGQDSAA